MLVRSIADYGAPYVDRTPVKNPQNDLSSAKGNMLMQDLAQLTATGSRAIARFICNATTNPPAADVGVWTIWGSGSSHKPVVTRTALGLYTLTWPVSFATELGETETVVFTDALAGARTTGTSHDTADIRTIASNVITVKVFAAGALSDLAGTGVVTVWAR